MIKFVIEDTTHADWHGEYSSFESALAELNKRADIPWNERPNIAPCTSWKTCGRSYEIIEYDDSKIPWIELNRSFIFEISANGIEWHNDENS